MLYNKEQGEFKDNVIKKKIGWRKRVIFLCDGKQE